MERRRNLWNCALSQTFLCPSSSCSTNTSSCLLFRFDEADFSLASIMVNNTLGGFHPSPQLAFYVKVLLYEKKLAIR